MEWKLLHLTPSLTHLHRIQRHTFLEINPVVTIYPVVHIERVIRSQLSLSFESSSCVSETVAQSAYTATYQQLSAYCWEVGQYGLWASCGAASIRSSDCCNLSCPLQGDASLILKMSTSSTLQVQVYFLLQIWIRTQVVQSDSRSH